MKSMKVLILEGDDGGKGSSISRRDNKMITLSLKKMELYPLRTRLVENQKQLKRIELHRTP